MATGDGASDAPQGEGGRQGDTRPHRGRESSATELDLGDKGTTMMSAKRGLGKLNATAFPRKPSASFHSQFSQ